MADASNKEKAIATKDRAVVTLKDLEGAMAQFLEMGYSAQITEVTIRVGKTRPSGVTEFAHNRGDYEIKAVIAVDASRHDAAEAIDQLSLGMAYQALTELGIIMKQMK